ncbi:XdhC family protein [Streptomyces sp. NPDC058691]|uniref:XdhC family protein n=1 Tax=Streptomyces sp. NPDC058691 TaxID=3346601 RepID=UPI0036608EEF
MRELIGPLRAWYTEGGTIGLATVVAAYRSAPRPPGAVMAVAESGEVAGSVSGGCVEAAVYEVAREVLRTGTAQLEQYGISDDEAFAVGLTCGGTIEVFVEPVSAATFPELPGVLDAVAAGRPVAVATTVSGADAGARLVVRPGDRAGGLGDAELDAVVAADVRTMLARGANGLRRYGERRVFVRSFAPPPRLLVFGATDFASALARQGALLGHRVTVCDARPVFTTAARFPDAHEVAVEWPHRYLAAEAAAGRTDTRTMVAVLTHDPKFDVPLLEVALRLPALGFVGAMGSRRTHEDRLERLRRAGLTPAELARLCSPIGLDIGALTPQETAVSIAAEIIAGRRGGSGGPLSATEGPIHAAAHRAPAAVGGGAGPGQLPGTVSVKAVPAER